MSPTELKMQPTLHFRKSWLLKLKYPAFFENVLLVASLIPSGSLSLVKILYLIFIVQSSNMFQKTKNSGLTVHYGVEGTTVNVRKMFKKFYWTYLLIGRSLKVALNRKIILKYMY
jgi:hypothetical protein